MLTLSRFAVGRWLACGVVLAAFGCAVSAAQPEQGVEAEQAPVAEQEQPQEQQPGREQGESRGELGAVFPGVAIDFDNHVVDVQATVCLNHGLLELIACTPDSKEHESIVTIGAVPMHVHAALLLAGANNGNPAMAQAANEEQTRWIQLPPQGDPIAVSLVYTNADGEEVDRPISDFIRRAEEEDLGLDAPQEPAAPGDAIDEGQDPAEVFGTFVFAGSQVMEDQDGNRHYLADYNGNVISISTFGDEVLCLPWIQTRENGELIWEADGDELPRVGTRVLLRLRLIQPIEEGADE